MDKPSVE